MFIDSDSSETHDALTNDLILSDVKNSVQWIFHMERPEGFHGKQIIRYSLFDNDIPVTFSQFFEALTNPESGIHRPFFQILKEFPSEAYFWEAAPVTPDSYYVSQYEFIILSSRELAGITADISSFESYINDAKSKQEVVANFWNIGRNAMLVAPCPLNVDANSYFQYSHLANFMKNGSYDHLLVFWHRVAVEFQKLMKSRHWEKVWISTSGLGVSWLHVRLDQYPKYYNYIPYKITIF
jgi:hypothetical protein